MSIYDLARELLLIKENKNSNIRIWDPLEKVYRIVLQVFESLQVSIQFPEI